MFMLFPAPPRLAGEGGAQVSAEVTAGTLPFLGVVHVCMCLRLCVVSIVC